VGIHYHDLDRYADLASPIHRWDPRLKLIGLGTLIAVIASLFSLEGAIVGAGMALLALFASRLPLRFLVSRFLGLQAFLLPFLIILPLLGSGRALVELGPLAVHAGGLEFALLIYIKALALVAVTVVLVNSAPLADTLWAAQSLHVPRGLVQLTLICLRYLPILLEEAEDTKAAATSRAFQMKAGSHSYTTAANMAGAVLVRSYLRASRVWEAMQCRGFRGRLYPLRRWRISGRDVALTAVAVIISVVLLAMDLTIWTTSNWLS